MPGAEPYMKWVHRALIISREIEHVSVAWLLRVVWEGVKRAEGGMASPLCDTPTGRSDEGGRPSCRVLCDYVVCVGLA